MNRTWLLVQRRVLETGTACNAHGAPLFVAGESELDECSPSPLLGGPGWDVPTRWAANQERGPPRVPAPYGSMSTRTGGLASIWISATAWWGAGGAARAAMRAPVDGLPEDHRIQR